jgi:DNA-binding CsgD family transcriptional regulator
VTVRLLRSLAPTVARTGLAPATALTPREAEVSRLVAEGRSNADIADALFLSAGTVKNHVASVQRKLGASNRVGIAAWAWESGLVR